MNPLKVILGYFSSRRLARGWLVLKVNSHPALAFPIKLYLFENENILCSLWLKAFRYFVQFIISLILKKNVYFW